MKDILRALTTTYSKFESL